MNFHSRMLFQPSFHNDLEVTLTNQTISIECIPEKSKWKESSYLKTEELNEIQSLLLDLATNKEVDNRLILDGIMVECEVDFGSGLKRFRFHSPEQSMRSHQLAEQLIRLCFEKFQSTKAIEILEQIEGYFSFSEHWKIIQSDPFTCKIHGSLCVYDQEGIAQFFESIKPQHNILVDLTNFEGMGTVLYDTFKQFNSEVSAKWMVKQDNERVINQLTEIGILKDQIIEV